MAGLVAAGAGTVLTAAWSARLSVASWSESPGVGPPEALGGLLAAWGVLALLLVSGLIACEFLARPSARWVLPFIVAVSAISQAILVAAPPVLSDDVWRYVHDGRVVAAGENPWLHPPAAPALDAIAGPERALVNHPSVRTAYPPAAEGMFALVVILGGGATALKALMAAAGLALTLSVAALLPAGARHRCLAVGWHPLLLLEGAASGHLDAIAVALATGGVVALARKRRGVGAALLALGALVKLLPAALAVALAPRLGPGRAVAVVVVTALGLAPMVLVDAPPSEQAGLAAYAEHWDFNGSAYPLVRFAVEGLDVKGLADGAIAALGAQPTPFSGPQFVTRGLLALLFAAALWVAMRRARSSACLTDALGSAGLWTCGAFALLAPTVHPWYLTWVLPFAVLRSSAAWLWLTLAVGLSHASAVAAGGGQWNELGWPRVLEYGPFLLLLLGASMASSRARRSADAGAARGDDR